MKLAELSKNKSAYFSVRGLFLALALLFHCTVVAYYFYPALIVSKHPIELDDASAYIHKASTMGRCGLNSNCSAYGSLLEQSKSSQAEVWLKNRFDGRLFCNYSPFHSLLLKFFYFFSNDWTNAYAILVIFGIALISFASAGLSWIWGGPFSAGLFLLFFSSSKFPGSGWQYIVPVNISLGFALLAWIFSLKARSRLAPMVLFTAASLATHPIGLVYALPTLMIFFQRRNQIPLLKSFGAIFATIVLIKGIVKVMEPSGISCSFGSTWGYEELNWVIAWDIFGRWVKIQGGGYASALGMVLLGIILLPKTNRRFAISISLVLISLYLISPLHILPGYAAELSQRLLLPLGLFFAGIQSHALAALLVRFLRRLKRFRGKNVLPISVFALFIFVLLLDKGRMMRTGLFGTFNEWNSLEYWRELISTNRTVSWSPDQSKILWENSKEGEEIVYNHEVGLYHHLAHGMHTRKALFLPYFPPSEKPKNLAETHRLFALSNPVVSRDLSISSLKIFSREKDTENWEVLLENRAFHATRVEISSNSQRVFSVSLESRTKKWVSLPKLVSQLGVVTIAKTENPVFVLGLKINSEQKSFWPWNQKIKIDHDSRPQEIDLRETFCEIDCSHEFELLSDEGSGLILRSKQ